jgi:hypothetical protein
VNSWCTGEDSNLRSSKERQIYSLLPLTARPPVPSHPKKQKSLSGDPGQNTQRTKKSALGSFNLNNPTGKKLGRKSCQTYTPLARFKPLQRITPHPESLRHFGACTSVGSPRRMDRRIKKTCKNYCERPTIRAASLANASNAETRFRKWSWRRDLNPRPSDYKSDALPAELRQPFPPETAPDIFFDPRSRARTHSRSGRTTAQKSRLAHTVRGSKRGESREEGIGNRKTLEV